MAWIERDHVDAAALTRQVALELQQACDEAIAARGSSWLALAGGRTPLPIYARFAASFRHGTAIAIPTDERCVPHADPASNLRALQSAFAGHPAITANALTTPDGDPQRSLAQARSLLALNAQPFDVVLLGMGADGHFASLFPGAANLAEGLATESGLDVIATVPDPLPPEAPYPRLSLTLPRLLRARAIHLVVTGEDKRRVLRRAQAHDGPGGDPVAALLHARDHQVRIHWSP